MKMINLCVVLLLITIGSALAIDVIWDKRFGGSDYDYCFNIVQSGDGGYVLQGDSYSGISGDKTESSRGDSDYWVVKVDSDGNKVWDKCFGGSGADYSGKILAITNGGYLVIGNSESGVSGDRTEASRGGYDYWVVKIDGSGNKIWDKRFGGSNHEYCYDASETDDGGYILAGYTYTATADGDVSEATRGGIDYWIVKVDSDGSKVWDKRYGGPGHDYLGGITKTSDGGYILAGHSYSDAGGDKTESSRGGNDYWVVKIDSAGNKTWDKRFGGSGIEYCFAAAETDDGGYLISGHSSSGANGDRTEPSRGNYDYWAVKVDGSGNKIWDKRFGGSDYDYCWNVIQTRAGGHILFGYSPSGVYCDKTEPSRGGHDYWLVNIDSDGNKIWDRRFGGSNDEYCYGICESGSGGYVVAGESDSPAGDDKTEGSRGDYDFWIIKFGRRGTDMDGDEKDDYGVYDTTGVNPGSWYFQLSKDGFDTVKFGYTGTLPVRGDFDGDRITDYGCYDATGVNPGTWYFMLSRDGFVTRTLGYAGTLPITGDFDGDGTTDYGVYDNNGIDPGSWFLMLSRDGLFTREFGYRGTLPVTGDFDGDGIDDYGCYDSTGFDPGSWYLHMSTDGFDTREFGYRGTLPVTGDFDGDDTDDYGCYDSSGSYTGSWYLMTSKDGFSTRKFGYKGTVPVTGDFDGDGTDDYGCYDADTVRPGSWYFMLSKDGFSTRKFGYKGTVPLN